jgi:hypothetical protein
MFSWNPHQKLAHFQVFYRLQKLALINFSRPDTVRPPPSQIQLVTRTLDVNFQPAPTACEQTSQQLVVYRTQFVTPFGQWVSNKNLKKGFHYFLFVFLLLLIDFLSSAGLRLQKKKKNWLRTGWLGYGFPWDWRPRVSFFFFSFFLFRIVLAPRPRLTHSPLIQSSRPFAGGWVMKKTGG